MSFAGFDSQTVALLQRSLERGRLAHAFLWSGTDSRALEKLAAALAKALNCHNPPAVAKNGAALDSCDQCSACTRIDAGNYPDLHWVRPESKLRLITIDQIREVMQSIHLKPSEGKFKVCILTAADRMNIQAANAFLKTLEEPPPNSILILLTPDARNVLETIASRCARLVVADDGTGRWDAGKLAWITSFARSASQKTGGLLGRYQLLGVLIEELARARARTEEELTQRSPLQQHSDADERLKDRWQDELNAAIEAEYRRERADLIGVLQHWLRDVWLVALGQGAELLHFPQLAEFTLGTGGRVSPKEAAANLAAMEKTQRLLGSNVQEALILEVGLLKLKL